MKISTTQTYALEYEKIVFNNGKSDTESDENWRKVIDPHNCDVSVCWVIKSKMFIVILDNNKNKPNTLTLIACIEKIKDI